MVRIIFFLVGAAGLEPARPEGTRFVVVDMYDMSKLPAYSQP